MISSLKINYWIIKTMTNNTFVLAYFWLCKNLTMSIVKYSNTNYYETYATLAMNPTLFLNHSTSLSKNKLNDIWPI